MSAPSGSVTARCHCGAVAITLARAPAWVTHCNCSLCHSYGVLWTYYEMGEVAFSPDTLPTATYAWNGKNVNFHHCLTCGCVTHWWPRRAGRTKVGINARLLPVELLAGAEMENDDKAGTGIFY